MRKTFFICLTGPQFLFSSFSLRVTSSFFCFNLLHAVDEYGHRLQRRRKQNDDVADAKRTESGFCRNDKNGRKGEKVNLSVHGSYMVEWSNGSKIYATKEDKRHVEWEQKPMPEWD